MFTDLPRTTAAAAYRSYLGADISKLQGLLPVAGEPDDIDNKGVANARCAVCHSTLDPLAYAFAPYNGFAFSQDLFSVLDLLVSSRLNIQFGMYDAMRPAKRMPAWSQAEQQPVVLGHKVASLREWAQVAADSDDFARNLASVFYKHALGRDAEAEALAEFTALWKTLPADQFSANRLIQRLVATRAFGAP